MIQIQSIADIELLRESLDLECKLAAGRDGQGAVPVDFWPTYSALANTSGGLVVLGIREKQGRFSVEGIANPAKVRKELFDSLNNDQKVSVNLLSDAHVRELVLDGRTVFVVEIPRATRKQRPVHLTRNPFAGHTYRRLNEGDRQLPDDEVKRMLAEQVEDSRDDRILQGYDIDDLDTTSFRAYRQVFANREPGHPWNAVDDAEFLRRIGGVEPSKTLQQLTQSGLLQSTGGRGAVYHIPGEALPTPDDVFGIPTRISMGSSPNLESSSPNLTRNRDVNGCLISDQLGLPVIDTLAALSSSLRQQLEDFAAEPRAKKKVSRDVLTDVVLRLCTNHYVTLRALAELVSRKPETLRDQYLTGLVRDRRLTLAFPTTPTHERQAYCAQPAGRGADVPRSVSRN